jgi:hypothetical protein
MEADVPPVVASAPPWALSPLGRLSNGFYRVLGEKSSAGRGVPFYPNYAQKILFRKIFVEGRRRILIPKSRKNGISTGVCLALLDMALSGARLSLDLIDRNQLEANKKLGDMVKFPHERLPDYLQRKVTKDAERFYELENGSTVRAAMNARGGTPHGLLVSELGPISFYHPKTAREIVTGAIQAAPMSSLVVVESTAMGKGRSKRGKVQRNGGVDEGNDGANAFYRLVSDALHVPPAMRGPEDWEVLFFAWHDKPGNVLQRPEGYVPKATNDYLDGVEAKCGKVITPAQRAWYQHTAVQGAGLDRFSEQPSDFDECFNAPIKGAIYREALAAARIEGRLTHVNYDPALPCFTAWDLDVGETNIWIFQISGSRVLVPRFVRLENEAAGGAAMFIASLGIRFAQHFLPHDGAARTNRSANVKVENTSYADLLSQAGLKGVTTLSRVPDKWMGINETLKMFPNVWFDAAGCAEGLEGLESYHRNEAGDEPVHDWASHPSDAFRYIAEALATKRLNQFGAAAGRAVGPRNSNTAGRAFAPKW